MHRARSTPVAREPEFVGAEGGVEQQHAAGASRGRRAARDAVHGERELTRRVQTLDARGAARWHLVERRVIEAVRTQRVRLVTCSVRVYVRIHEYTRIHCASCSLKGKVKHE